MKSLLISYITEFILSDKRLTKNRIKAEKKRNSDHLPHTLEVFIAIDDPASFLLLQVLPELKQRYNLTLKFRTVLKKNNDMFPEQALWDNNILNDSIRMAELYRLKQPSAFCLDEALILKASKILASWELQDDYLIKANELFNAAWMVNKVKVNDLIEATDSNINSEKCAAQLTANETYLLDQGHYLSGTIFYAKEWYWGLERLQYLEKRLNSLILSAPNVIKYNKLHNLYQPVTKPIIDKNTPLTIYFSLRSPYSYLGLLRAIKLSEHYQIPLELKPVLPMLMRGMQVPKKKSMYIVLDTKREANSYNISFGKIADPLGKGVERCYALFDYAKSEGKEIEFIKNYAGAVWSQRVFSETNKGLKQIVEQSDLDWQQAQTHLTDESWRNWADTHLKELFALGLWGVPSFKYKDTSVFGQDKLLFIEQAISQ